MAGWQPSQLGYSLQDKCSSLALDALASMRAELPEQELCEHVYEPFRHWSVSWEASPITRDRAAWIANAVGSSRNDTEQPTCQAAFLTALLLRSSMDLKDDLTSGTIMIARGVFYAAFMDLLRVFEELVLFGVAAAFHTSWPLREALLTALHAFRTWGQEKGAETLSLDRDCGCRDAHSAALSAMLTPWKDSQAGLDISKVPLPSLRDACELNPACVRFVVLQKILCGEYHVLTSSLEAALKHRVDAAGLSLVSPACPSQTERAIRPRDAVFNAAKLRLQVFGRGAFGSRLTWQLWPDVETREGQCPQVCRAAGSGAPRHRAAAAGFASRPPLRMAIYSSLVETKDHYKKGDFVLEAIRLKCSAARMGSTLPHHLIYGGGLSDLELHVLRHFGFVIQDHSADIHVFKEIYRPVYSATQAATEARWWDPHLDVAKYGNRTDGWATYLKFFAWKAADFDVVLHADLDLCFWGRSPELALQDFPLDVSFMSKMHFEKHGQFNTALFANRPSASIFDDLVRRAREGRYFPMTNTEQDVLNAQFPRHVLSSQNDINRLVPHEHWCSRRNSPWALAEHCLRRNDPAVLARLAGTNCDRFWEGCVSRRLGYVTS